MYVAPSYSILLSGRVTYGVGIGFAMHAAPAYIAETCPARVRSYDLCCCMWVMHPFETTHVSVMMRSHPC